MSIECTTGGVGCVNIEVRSIEGVELTDVKYFRL